MLLDPISVNDLIRLLEQLLESREAKAEDHDNEAENHNSVHEALTSALSYLTLKREYLVIKKGKLPEAKSLQETNWTTYSKPTTTVQGLPTRRTRLRTLRAQWRTSRQSPSKLIRKVRFTTDDLQEEVVDAPETPRKPMVGRSSSTDSRDEWFTAPEEPIESIETGESLSEFLGESGIKGEGGDAKEGGRGRGRFEGSGET